MTIFHARAARATGDHVNLIADDQWRAAEGKIPRIARIVRQIVGIGDPTHLAAGSLQANQPRAGVDRRRPQQRAQIGLAHHAQHRIIRQRQRVQPRRHDGPRGKLLAGAHD